MVSFAIYYDTLSAKSQNSHQRNPSPIGFSPNTPVTRIHRSADSSNPTPLRLTTFTSFAHDRYNLASKRRKKPDNNMATYYHYDENGKLVGSSAIGPVLQYPSENGNDNTQVGEHDPVGLYLARRGLLYSKDPVMEASGVEQPALRTAVGTHGEQQEQGVPETSYRSAEAYDSPGDAGSSQSESSRTVGFAGWAAHSGQYRPYPNPDHIRHLHTLHSLLPYIQPERRLNALKGPAMDIVEQDSGVVLAYAVPKKLLVLFLGRKVVNKFVKTIEREDNENWCGRPVVQQLLLPRYKSSKVAAKALVAWMIRACQYHTMNNMKSIQIPTNTFAMCSLAQTMELFSLRRDAYRIDLFISDRFRTRPVFASELEALWNCLDDRNRYLYAAITTVGKRLRAYEAGSTKALPEPDDMFALLEANPRLGERVRDLKVNEQYQPTFGTEWMRNLDQHHSPNDNQYRQGEDLCPDPTPSGKEQDVIASQNTGDAGFERRGANTGSDKSKAEREQSLVYTPNTQKKNDSKGSEW